MGGFQQLNVWRKFTIKPGGQAVCTGAYTDDCFDFTDADLTHSGSNGPCFIRAGTYASPVSNTSEEQSGFMRLYGTTSADGTSYDRGVFVCLKTTGTKGIFPVSGLAEVLEQTGAGPTKAQAAQFIAGLHTATSKLATIGADTTAGMYGAWLKVYSVTGSEASSGSRVAAVWLDNQMSGTVSGEEYTIFSTTGGTKPDAWAAFETTSSGWTNFLYFDETAYDELPVVSAEPTGSTKKYLAVSLNGTAYGIPLNSVAQYIVKGVQMLKKLEGLTKETRAVLQGSIENVETRGITVAELRRIDKVCKILEQDSETLEFEDEDFDYLKHKFQTFDGWRAEAKIRDIVLRVADILGV